jgi:hypothetical protein
MYLLFMLDKDIKHLLRQLEPGGFNSDALDPSPLIFIVLMDHGVNLLVFTR